MIANQRGFAVLVLVYVITAVLAVGATYAFLEKRCNSACKDARAEVATLTAEKEAAQKRATAMAMLAAQRLADTDKAVRAEQEKAHATIADLETRARALRGRVARLSLDAARVLDDASRAANSPAAAVDQGTAPAVPDAPSTSARLVTYDEGELAEWGVMAAAAYASCRIKHAACVTAYERVRSAYQEPP